MTESHVFLDVLAGHPSVMRHKPADLPQSSASLGYHYVRPALRDVDLGFAGRFRPSHPHHRAIAGLSPGDPLETRITSQGRWELLDRRGAVVGRLAAGFKPPPGTRCRSAEVWAVTGWSREASNPEFHVSIRCDAWEVVVPELVFEPDRQATTAST